MVGIALGFALAAALGSLIPHVRPSTAIAAKTKTEPKVVVERPDSAFRCRGAVAFCMTFETAGVPR
jgi:hypothetical protein